MNRANQTWGIWLLASSLFAASTLGMAPSPLPEVEERKADVQVVNKTGRDIEFVTVAHKYSDNYKESKTWGNMANGVASKDTLEVQYHTGFGTTGQDWWLITWRYKGDPTVYMTAPKNFREIVDAVEKLAITALPAAGKFVGSLIGGEAGGEIGGPAAKEMGSALLNSESTVGFKSHILRKRRCQTRQGDRYRDYRRQGDLQVSLRHRGYRGRQDGSEEVEVDVSCILSTIECWTPANEKAGVFRFR